MAKLKDFGKMRKRWLKDAVVRQEYELLAPEFQIAEEVIRARVTAGLTQAELAQRIGTKSTAISRLESPNYGRASISMLRRIADALDCDLEVRLIPHSSSR